MSVVAIVQARTSSSRLPGKVLLPVGGKPMIVYQLERVVRCKRIDRLVMATSIDATDDYLASIVESAGFRVFRGELTDVLERFRVCATS